MTIPVLLLPNSMPLDVRLRLIASALLLLFCSTSCLGTRYEDCFSNIVTCGDVEFGYPFGKIGSGCGDPQFQLQGCDYESHTLIKIAGNQYHILESSFLANSSMYKRLTLVNDNVWGKCNLSGNYSVFWRAASVFQLLDTYTNLTLWKHCDQVPENISGLAVKNLSLCGDDWYYSLSPHLNLERTPFCNVFQLPIQRNLTQPIDNQTLAQGFEVTWHVDPNIFRTTGNGTQESSYGEGRGGRNKSAIIIGCSVAGVALTAIALLLFLRFYAKMGKPTRGRVSSTVEKFLKEYACEMPTRYSLSHLKKITNNFAEKLGEGGYGVVYKGMLPKGALVAVKVLDRHKHSEIQFMNEVATIGRRVHHFNLVRLMGYCFEGITSALIYEFMVNGSLEKFIFAQKEQRETLNWENLFAIALGAARGIAYLHQDCDKRIIHFDIKPHNILLDADFTAKVSDFGLAKLCGKGDDHISMTAARGTPGYVAPELCDNDLGPVTDKSDVYSFGMLLLEIVGSRKNIDWKVSRSSQFYLPEWAFKLLERGEMGMRLRGEETEPEDEEKAKRLTKVGLWCIQYNWRDRPCMSRVIQMLEGNGDDVSDPPLPFNSSKAAPENPLSSAVQDSSLIEVRL